MSREGNVVIVTDAETLTRIVDEAVRSALERAGRPPLKLLTPDEAGQLLGVNPRTLLRWVKTREIPHRQVGPKLVRFVESELVAWNYETGRKAG